MLKRSNESRRTFFRFITFLVCLGLTTGCASPKLRITTDPGGALVTVHDAAGNVIVPDQSEPVTFDVTFDNDAVKYMIEVRPRPADADEFEHATQEITRQIYDQALELGDDLRELRISLARKEYEPTVVVNLTVGYDGKWMGVVHRERAYRNIAESGGATPTRIVSLINGSGITGMSMSPDGMRIVYSLAKYDVDNIEKLRELRLDEHRELRLKSANLRGVRLDGSSAIQHITSEDFQDMFPSFAAVLSTDTSREQYLLFCSNRRRAAGMDILRASADGRGGISDIYIEPRGNLVVRPTQASDGTIAFSVYPRNWSSPNDVQIWTIGGPNQYPTQVAVGMQPQISPDGRRIAFIGVDGNLWVVGTDGREATQLTSRSEQILANLKSALQGLELELFKDAERSGNLLRYYHPYSFPSWSPDGQQLLFTSLEGADPTGRPNEDIYIMDSTGGRAQQLTTNGSVDRFPLMSPDGRWVYFISNRGLEWAIWRIPVQR